MSHRETLAYLYGLERFGMVFGLENILRLLQILDDPHQDLRVIHVGGTNGKGSVSAMMASVLQAEGYRVGLYTSPHLVSFTERIRINGVEIAWEEVVRLTDLMRSKIEAAGIPHRFTFFDFTTALAMYYFIHQAVDLCILEVGLGGRLDSTNVVRPLLTVITNVDKDHFQILGDQVEDIAREKAGIVKHGIPVVSGATRPSVIQVLEDVCRDKEAPLRLAGRDFRGAKGPTGTLEFHGRRWHLADITVGIAGRFQIENAVIALGALEVLEEQGLGVSRTSIAQGLSAVRWPGRFELIQQSPQVVLDGAHNAAAARSLRQALQEEFDCRQLYMVMGIMADKEVSAVVAELAPLATGFIATRPHNARAMPPQRVAEIARRYCGEVKVIEDVVEGVDYLRAVVHEDDLIVVTGSLFTVGEAREHLLRKEPA
jgi:dihydrofolate synthase/folylpolyglutamate synthase